MCQIPEPPDNINITEGQNRNIEALRDISETERPKPPQNPMTTRGGNGDNLPPPPPNQDTTKGGGNK
jgi:hypothetical protein